MFAPGGTDTVPARRDDGDDGDDGDDTIHAPDHPHLPAPFPALVRAAEVTVRPGVGRSCSTPVLEVGAARPRGGRDRRAHRRAAGARAGHRMPTLARGTPTPSRTRGRSSLRGTARCRWAASASASPSSRSTG